MIDCKLKQIHRVKHSIPIKINKQTHKFDELVYFISGSGSTQINDKTFYYKAGDFAFYKMGTPHDEYDPNPCDIIWMHFSFNIDNIDLKEGLFSDNNRELLSVLQKLRTAILKPGGIDSNLVEVYLAEAVITAFKCQNKTEDTTSRTNWEQILNYIDANINKEINFSDIAKHNNYSYDRFRHLFAEHFSKSPYAYLIEQRIEHSKRLLKNSSLSITDIAFDCGFNSSSQFCNIFKKRVGITPKEYKKRVSFK